VPTTAAAQKESSIGSAIDSAILAEFYAGGDDYSGDGGGSGARVKQVITEATVRNVDEAQKCRR
jgi:hypothetical protein